MFAQVVSNSGHLEDLTSHSEASGSGSSVVVVAESVSSVAASAIGRKRGAEPSLDEPDAKRQRSAFTPVSPVRPVATAPLTAPPGELATPADRYQLGLMCLNVGLQLLASSGDEAAAASSDPVPTSVPSVPELLPPPSDIEIFEVKHRSPNFRLFSVSHLTYSTRSITYASLTFRLAYAQFIRNCQAEGKYVSHGKSGKKSPPPATGLHASRTLVLDVAKRVFSTQCSKDNSVYCWPLPTLPARLGVEGKYPLFTLGDEGIAITVCSICPGNSCKKQRGELTKFS